MNAADVIENIKSLPPGEQQKIFTFVAQFVRAESGLPPVHYMRDEEFRIIAKKVFEENDELFRKLAAYERAEREGAAPERCV
jgi:hypothetical protein